MRAKKVVCFHKLIRTINIVSNTGHIIYKGTWIWIFFDDKEVTRWILALYTLLDVLIVAVGVNLCRHQ